MTADARPGPPVIFTPVSGSWAGKVACSVCHRTGYRASTPGRFSPWQRRCLSGHAPCDFCGQMLIVKLDGTPRVHTRCKG